MPSRREDVEKHSTLRSSEWRSLLGSLGETIESTDDESSVERGGSSLSV